MSVGFLWKFFIYFRCIPTMWIGLLINVVIYGWQWSTFPTSFLLQNPTQIIVDITIETAADIIAEIVVDISIYHLL